jgi:hypothetical protein
MDDHSLIPGRDFSAVWFLTGIFLFATASRWVMGSTYPWQFIKNISQKITYVLLLKTPVGLDKWNHHFKGYICTVFMLKSLYITFGLKHLTNLRLNEIWGFCDGESLDCDLVLFAVIPLECSKMVRQKECMNKIVTHNGGLFTNKNHYITHGLWTYSKILCFAHALSLQFVNNLHTTLFAG